MNYNKYFDAHCHLQDLRFDSQIDKVINKSFQFNVEYLCTCGTSEADWDKVINLSNQYPRIIPALGIHPWFVNTVSHSWLRNLKHMISKYNTAVGECGLDFVVQGFDKEKQLYVFEQQVLLAQAEKRPISIHCRGAWKSLIEVLDKVGNLPGSGLIHSYSGSAEMLIELEKRGFYISFSGSVTNTQNKKIAKALEVVSNHRLLIETDSPDIMPRNIPDYKQKQLNKPYYLPFISEMIAKRTGKPQNDIIQRSYKNAKTLFSSYINE